MEFEKLFHDRVHKICEMQFNGTLTPGTVRQECEFLTARLNSAGLDASAHFRYKLSIENILENT